MQQSQEKIARLEQEKEHWLLEAQLGRVRLEKENQRISQLEAQLSAALGAAPAPQTLPGEGGGTPASQEEAELEERGAGKEFSQSTSLVRRPVSTLYICHLTEQKLKLDTLHLPGDVVTCDCLTQTDATFILDHQSCTLVAKYSRYCGILFHLPQLIIYSPMYDICIILCL